MKNNPLTELTGTAKQKCKIIVLMKLRDLRLKTIQYEFYGDVEACIEIDEKFFNEFLDYCGKFDLKSTLKYLNSTHFERYITVNGRTDFLNVSYTLE